MSSIRKSSIKRSLLAGSRTPLIRKLKKLSPIQFEHCIYDLLILSGLRNAVWRTPGPDAGRDIEGQVVMIDLSENVTVERWYVECKRYKLSLDWPTVYEKIAYAHNHGADFLLFATTGTLSPRCKEEISKREAARDRPLVRVWDAAVLENFIARHPLLLVKYGLSRESRQMAESILPLVTITSKVIQATYGRAILRRQMDPALEFGAALVDLISARLIGMNGGGSHPVRRFVLERDLYSWCKVDKDVDLRAYDSYGLRALLTALRFFMQTNQISVKSGGSRTHEITLGADVGSRTVQDALAMLAIWSNLEVRIVEGKVVISIRAGDGHGR